ncbi:MAG: hypothetical protein OEW85_12905, partial [Acidimicrobiia bacterium]|nr:hypothetical protein [Acidimicrobiia bacterium]
SPVPPWLMKLPLLLSTLLLLAGACGDADGDGASPASTTRTAVTTTSVTTAAPTTTAAMTGTTTPPPPSSAPARPLVATGDGLGVASFGDEAEVAIGAITERLGAPSVDTGWKDPRDPANESLWPGCPGTLARMLQWTDNLSAVFTNWDGDLNQPAGTVETPTFSGYVLWSTTDVETPEGAGPGTTLAELRTLYGDRLFVADQPDDAIGQYVWAMDGTWSPLHRTGGLRGWLLPPEGATGEPRDDWTAGSFTAGVGCGTP